MTVKILSNENAVKKTGNMQRYPDKKINETLTNGFFVVDQKWTVKYWNNAAEILLKVKAKDILGKNLWEEFAAIIPLEFYSVYQKAFLQDIPLHFEEYWGEMGAWFDVITYYCDNTLSVSFKSSNHPHTEYPESPLQRLKTLTELYRFVTEITNDCLWEWDLLANEIFWIDGGHKRIFGYQVENALIPESFWESRIHPADKERVLTGLMKIISTGTECLWEDEYRFAKADGSYAYVHDRGHIICTDGEASRIIGATRDITDKVLLQKELEQQALTHQREITSAIIIAQENERLEIGRELHDNINQVLAITNIYIQLAQKNVNKREMFLEKSSGFILDAIEEIRKISKKLIPLDMEFLGLSHSIKILLADFRIINSLKIDYHEDGINLQDLDQKLQLNIFRIIQEQLNNILKHAEATHVGIKLSGEKNEIILFISDDGKGTDISAPAKGVGIRNIMSRAELFHGNVTITTKRGKGYSLSVVFPKTTEETHEVLSYK